MKKTTCKNLRGACDAEIFGKTPEEMAENAKKHGMEMFAAGDQAHIEAGKKMQQLSPEEQQAWYVEFVKNFDSLPNA